jgi:cystathionine gamma-synthase
MHFDTRALHTTQPDPGTGAVVSPLHLSTTFARNEANQLPGPYLYARPDNPTRHTFETALAGLEGGAVGMAFASGQAASMTLLQALAPGDHVVVAQDAYYGTPALLEQLFQPWGLTFSRIDLSHPSDGLAGLRKALTPRTRLVWCESPSNPMLALTDLLAVAMLAHEAGAICVCDNTWATPALQRPLALNCDVVMHATTKYIGGHSDMLGGALVFKRNDALAQRVRQLQGLGGAVAAPFDCYLALRGLKTLGVRMRAQTQTARLIADFLADHPAVEAVYFPGLATHPAAMLARQQMDAPGAMLSVQVRGDAATALGFISRLRVFARATSLGGVESLIEHRATVEGPASATPANLLRLSVGLEHPDDLIDDLAMALAGPN